MKNLVLGLGLAIAAASVVAIADDKKEGVTPAVLNQDEVP
jgi:hypothetical protein